LTSIRRRQISHPLLPDVAVFFPTPTFFICLFTFALLGSTGNRSCVLETLRCCSGPPPRPGSVKFLLVPPPDVFDTNPKPQTFDSYPPFRHPLLLPLPFPNRFTIPCPHSPPTPLYLFTQPIPQAFPTVSPPATFSVHPKKTFPFSFFPPPCLSFFQPTRPFLQPTHQAVIFLCPPTPRFPPLSTSPPPLFG